MKKILITIIILILIGCDDNKVVHPDKLQNIEIVNVYQYNSTHEQIVYWDLTDTVLKRRLVHECYKNRFKVGEKY